jgi:hypothetical protein
MDDMVKILSFSTLVRGRLSQVVAKYVSGRLSLGNIHLARNQMQ